MWSIGVDTPDSVLCLPQLLRDDAGYRTAIIGKSHFKSCGREGSLEALPRSQDWEFFRHWDGPWFGFDFARINVGHVHEPHSYAMHYGLWLRERGIPNEPPYFWSRQAGHPNDFSGRWELPEEFHQASWAADQSIEYLRDHKTRGGEQPFFLSLNFADPHQPWFVPAPWDTLHDDVTLPPPIRRREEWKDKPSLYRASVLSHPNTLGWNDDFGVPDQYSDGFEHVARTAREERIWRIYLGMTSLVDFHLGRVLESLDELDLTRDTLVIFTSDHGDFMGDHWLWSKGGSHYDGAARIPFVVRWPRRTAPGERSQSLQSLVDLPSTLLSVAGLQPHPAMQGIDQTASWENPQVALREGVLLDHRVAEGLYVNSWITDRYRLSVHAILAESRTETEMYDFHDDPNEWENLAAGDGHAPLQAELLKQLLRYRLKIAAPWPPRLAYA